MGELSESFAVSPKKGDFPILGKPTYEQLEQKVLALEKQVREGRHAQLELQESKECLNAVLDTIQAGIIVIDSESRTVVGANAAAGKMMGMPEHKIVGKTCQGFICPQEQGGCSILDRGHSLVNSEQSLLTARGEKIPVLKTAVSIMLVGRKHVLESFVDITERKRAEQEREALIEKLQEALSQVKMLSGLLPICASCKKIRDDKGCWNPLEVYIRDRSEAEFSHGICPDCAKELYPGFSAGKE